VVANGRGISSLDSILSIRATAFSQDVRGGPERPGGGEEMGGVREVLHLMQRTPMQGSLETLVAIGHR
jgi:hypothetical protein